MLREGQSSSALVAVGSLLVTLSSWVMGHPMGTPFPYYFCTASQQRVLGMHALVFSTYLSDLHCSLFQLSTTASA
jgi:hypothetical protein